ncbi:MAG: hypothetical protein GC162_08990 [Planctomycetes bacterium]|nr:hypothetical protein [Planctomycetota bacterium]
MGLESRPGFRYSVQEFAPKIAELDKQGNRAHALEDAQRDAFDKQILEFADHVQLFSRIVESSRTPPIQSAADLQPMMARLTQLEQFPLPLTIPPRDAKEKWKPFMRASLESMLASDPDLRARLSMAAPNPYTQSLATIIDAWGRGDVATFNSEVKNCQRLAKSWFPADRIGKLSYETFFNHFEPFYQCAVLYVVALVLVCFAWLVWGDVLNKAALGLIVVTLIGHTFALGSRIYISGYPPITNLYGTAIFIGWGCVLLGVLLEFLYPIGVGNLVAAVIGFTTLLIAHFLSLDGDTLQMMQAVLDTKFWLATHVIIINLGYVATYLAGFIAMVYIIRGTLTATIDKNLEKIFTRMIYGVVCFALLNSFVGTVLGGLWADDSWGRFWGWDPKENGALIIVLWNALILHARWGGMVKSRGLAVLAVMGNIVTSWSWFGVNQLGVGLHSYGFISSVAFWLIVFVCSQLVIIALGLMPRHLWRSFAESRDEPKGDVVMLRNM